MAEPKRVLLAVVFVLAAVLCGLAVGTWIGGRFFVPPGSGLAGPAIALGYGVLGAGIALVIAIVALKFVPRRAFGWLAVPVLLVGTLLVGLVAAGIMRSRAETARYMAEAYENLNAFEITLVHTDAGAGPFQSMQIDWAKRQYTAVGGGTSPRTCTAALSGAEAVTLLTALRNIEVLLAQNSVPCAGTAGDTEREIAWSIVEALPPNSGGALAITAVCRGSFPELDAPFAAAQKIFTNGDHPRQCTE